MAAGEPWAVVCKMCRRRILVFAAVLQGPVTQKLPRHGCRRLENQIVWSVSVESLSALQAVFVCDSTRLQKAGWVEMAGVGGGLAQPSGAYLVRCGTGHLRRPPLGVTARPQSDVASAKRPSGCPGVLEFSD